METLEDFFTTFTRVAMLAGVFHKKFAKLPSTGYEICFCIAAIGAMYRDQPSTPNFPTMQQPNRTSSLAILRVALLFHASKVYDREIAAGIGEYVKQTRVDWDLFLEEAFRFRLNGIHVWEGERGIADYDAPAVAQTLLTPRGVP